MVVGASERDGLRDVRRVSWTPGAEGADAPAEKFEG